MTYFFTSNIRTLPEPNFYGAGVAAAVSGATRVTEDGDTRIVEGGSGDERETE